MADSLEQDVDAPPAVAPGERRRRSDQHTGRRRRTTSRRRSRRRQKSRQQQLARIGIWLFAVVAVGMAAVWAVLTFGGDVIGDEADTPAVAASDLPETLSDDPQPTLVLATFDETTSVGADQVMILAVDPATGEGTIVLVPSNVVADVPGEGLFRLGETFREGQAPLLELTLANLLGLDLDGGAAISEQGWSSLFTRMGGLTLDVPEQLVEVADDGTRTIRFQPGVQPLDGPRVAEYLTFRQEGETELQRLPRVQLVLEAMLDRVAEDPAVLDEVFGDGAPMVDAPDADALRYILESLAAARQAGDLDVRTLPVTSIGSGEDASYRIDEARVERLVEERFAGSRPTGGNTAGRRLQVLNGNGVPGIGSEVAERLQPGGFRLVETGNASSFDVGKTRIVVSDDRPEQLQVARRAQELLGTGRIEVSEVPVSVVDVTVIVGADFP
jgi:anionic cell wall polymer biosynthesis LytR-Cps2A-Psr (LCP) family protein